MNSECNSGGSNAGNACATSYFAIMFARAEAHALVATAMKGRGYEALRWWSMRGMNKNRRTGVK